MKKNGLKKGMICAALLSAGLLLCGQKTEAAEMPTTKQLKTYQKDGSLEKRIEYYKNAGGENYSDGLIRKKEAESEIATYSNLPEEWGTYMPSEGEAKVLLLRVDFPDMTFEEGDTEEALKNIAFGENTESYTVYPYESLSAYYERASYGKLHISGDTLSYTAQHERSYYEEQGIASLYTEVLDAIDPEVDFSQYDGNHDGYIDGLYLHFAGENTGWASCWWSVTYRDLLPDAEYDGMHVGGCVTLHTRSDSKDGAQTLIHETGHLLGLPDYYNYTDHSFENGLCAYDMMMDNTGDHNAFSKWLLGWIEDDEIKAITLDEKEEVSEDVILESLSKEKQDGNQYKCAVVSPKNAGMFSEYLLVEYDTEQENQTGLRYMNKKLPDGFRVFHVNARLDDKKNFIYNNEGENKLIKLVDKDEEVDDYHFWNGSYDDSSVTEVYGKGEEYGCKYLKGDSLTPDTVPSTDLLKGQFLHKSGISITEFEPDGDNGKIAVSVKKVEPSQDDLKVQIGNRWKDLNQNNIILLPVILNEDVDINEEKSPYLVDKDGNKITGELYKGTGKGKYFIVIHSDYLEAGEYECVLPKGAFHVEGVIESEEQKASIHVGENMKMKSSGTLKVTNSIFSCKAEDSGWYVLEPQEADGTEGCLYKISEKGEVTEQKIDTQNWSAAWGYDPETMQTKEIKCLADGTLAVVFEAYNPDRYVFVHMNTEGETLNDIETIPGRDWNIHVVGNTIKAMKNIWDDRGFYSIEFGKEVKELDFSNQESYKFMKDGYIVYSVQKKEGEESEENAIWARLEYRNAQDEIVDSWEYPFGRTEGKMSLLTVDGAVMNDEEIYLIEMDPQDNNEEDDDYVLCDMHLKVYAIDRKTGEFREIKLKDEAFRFGAYKDNYSSMEISDVSEQNGKLLFSIRSWFCSGAAPVDDTYCLNLEDGAITKRIGRYYSSASILSGTKVMEIDWSEEYPKYLIYDAEDETTPDDPDTPDDPSTPDDPGTPDDPSTPDTPDPSDKPADPDKKGADATATGTSAVNKNVNKTTNKTTTNKTTAQNAKKASTAKTGDTAPFGVYAVLLCISAAVVIVFVMKRRKK